MFEFSGTSYINLYCTIFISRLSWPEWLTNYISSPLGCAQETRCTVIYSCLWCTAVTEEVQMWIIIFLCYVISCILLFYDESSFLPYFGFLEYLFHSSDVMSCYMLICLMMSCITRRERWCSMWASHIICATHHMTWHLIMFILRSCISSICAHTKRLWQLTYLTICLKVTLLTSNIHKLKNVLMREIL